MEIAERGDEGVDVLRCVERGMNRDADTPETRADVDLPRLRGSGSSGQVRRSLILTEPNKSLRNYPAQCPNQIKSAIGNEICPTAKMCIQTYSKIRR